MPTTSYWTTTFSVTTGIQTFFFEVYKHSKLIGKRLETASERRGEEPAVLRGYRNNGPTKWRSWKKFDEESIKATLRKAVENHLIPKEWLKMI